MSCYKSLFLLCLALSAFATLPVMATSCEKPTVGQLAPNLVLVSVNNKRVSLIQLRGRPVALFFFCGCRWCTECAKEWGQVQRSGALCLVPTTGARQTVSPVTLVVFSGNAAATNAFALDTGLDLKQTLLLPDPLMYTTLAYNAEPCPRVYVINRNTILKYTNNHRDDAPRKAPALAIASRVLVTLQDCLTRQSASVAHLTKTGNNHQMKQ